MGGSVVLGAAVAAVLACHRVLASALRLGLRLLQVASHALDRRS
eukprot:SAG25_NODE_12495_length_279_cov_0.755556_1_plen_43_part_01